MWCSVRVDAQFTVGRKSRINLGSQLRQFVLQRGGEVLAAFRNAEGSAVGRQPCLAFRPGQELGTVVGKFLGADDVDIAGLHGISQIDEDANFKRASIEGTRAGSTFADKALPTLGSKAEIDRIRQFMPACMTVLAHDRQGIQQAMILRRRSDVHEIEQAEQQAAVPGMDRPEQRQIVVAVPRGYRFALLGQRLDAALFHQEFSDPAPERIVGLLVLCRFEHLAENSDQGFLDSTVLIMQSLQLLLGRGLSSPDAPQQHLDQFIATAHACLTQKGEQQRVPLARLGDVEKFAHLQRRSFSGELAELGVGDTLQKRIGINQAGQPIKPLDPEPDCLRGCGPGRLLQAIEAGRRAVGRLDQQGIQHRQMFRRQTRGHTVVDPRVNFRAQPIHQAVKRAERRQIDRRRLQRLDRSVDQVGRVAHGFGGFERGFRNQPLAPLAIRRDARCVPNRRLVAIQRFRLARLVGPDRRRSVPAARPGAPRCPHEPRPARGNSRGPGGFSAVSPASRGRSHRGRSARMKARSVSVRLYRAPSSSRVSRAPGRG